MNAEKNSLFRTSDNKFEDIMSTKPTNDKKGKKQKKKKGVLREWLDSIVFAVVAATIIRWLFIEAYMIPTPSMENSLLVGDYLFVSKMHYGARTPQTPLQIPLTFQKIWGTNIPSYLDWVELPMLRLPGFSDVERYDPVVFNYPHEEIDNGQSIPADIRTYYIKRCIGLPGDKLALKDKQVYINDEPIENPEGMQSSYMVYATQSLNVVKVFIENDIYVHNFRNGRPHALLDHMVGTDSSGTTIYPYLIHTSPEKIEKIRSKDMIREIVEIKDATLGGEFKKFHQDWSYDNFGAITIPKEGWTVELTPANISDYQHAIVNYEYNDNAEYKDGKIFIDGNEIKEYTFKQDYYFMMGDNRHNSADSRAWGFVPADHIVGKALFTWWSVNPFSGWGSSSKVRWDRVFRLID